MSDRLLTASEHIRLRLGNATELREQGVAAVTKHGAPWSGLLVGNGRADCVRTACMVVPTRQTPTLWSKAVFTTPRQHHA